MTGQLTLWISHKAVHWGRRLVRVYCDAAASRDHRNRFTAPCDAPPGLSATARPDGCAVEWRGRSFEVLQAHSVGGAFALWSLLVLYQLFAGNINHTPSGLVLELVAKKTPTSMKR